MATGSSIPPASAASGELQSTVTLLDFFQSWYRYRVAFVVGLLIVSGTVFVMAKFVMMKFYRAETRIFVGRQFAPETKLGAMDIKGFERGRNESLRAVVLAIVAEQLLTSRELLSEAVARLKTPDEGDPIDVYELLNIQDPSPEWREGQLIKLLRDDLIRLNHIQNSGFIVFSVELPDPRIAARFANVCVEVLQERFTDLEFSYEDQSLKAYEQKLKEELAYRAERTAQLDALDDKSRFDWLPSIRKELEAYDEELTLQAEWLADLRNRIQLMRLATSPEAKAASQPVRVIDRAYPPLKKNRPKTILSTLMVSALYTMIFMVGLMLVSYLRWSAPSPANE